MGYRVVTQAERDEMAQIPNQREMGNIERMIRKNTMFAPREAQGFQPIPKSIPQPPPKPAPQPIIPPASVADTIIPDHDILPLPEAEPAKVVHEKPLDPEFLFKKRTQLFRPIPTAEPVVAEAHAIAGVAASPSFIPVMQDPIIAASEYPDITDIYNKPIPSPISLPEIAIPKFAFPKPKMPHLPKMDYGNGILIVFFIVKMALAAALVYLGLTITGSYYTPSSRLAGDLATLAYKYQLGQILAFVGALIAYDTIRFRTRKES